MTTERVLPDGEGAGTLQQLVVLLIGLCISAAAALWVRHSIDAQASAEFARHVEGVADEVVRRFRQPVYGLRGANGAFMAAGQIRRNAFRAYVESRDLPLEFRGVRGFGFIERVRRENLGAFIAGERADNAPGFDVHPLPGGELRDDLYVIKYIEPEVRNVGVAGLDLGSDPIRRAAAELAILTGEPTLTAVITLAQDASRGSGFLLYLPVFRNGADPVTLEQRRGALVGLAYAPIVASELLSGVGDATSGAVGFSLRDVSEGALPQPVPLFEDRVARNASRYEEVRTIAVLGRKLALQVRSTAQFDNSIAQAPPLLVFGASALLSTLLAALIRQLSSGRRRAEDLAAVMTADLARLAQVVRHTSNSVAITDTDMRIVWINEGFTRISGYTLEQALGKTHDELLGDGGGEPAVLRNLAGTELSSDGCRVEIFYRHRDGHDYWLDAEFQPLYDAQGQLTGFMEIGSDVTTRRAEQGQLEAALRDHEGLLRTIDLYAIVSVTDAGGWITDANDAFCRISGYPREELIGQNHRILNSGLQPDSMWSAMWQSVCSGTPWRGEVCNRAKNGSVYWVDSVIAPFMGADGKVEKYISIRTDITANKNAARELARERQRLENILKGTDVGTWEWNIETGDLRINERWAQMAGYTLEELGKITVDTWSRLAHPEDLSRSSALLYQHFDGEVPGYECEVRMKHKSGHWVWVLVRGRLFSRSVDGRPRRMAGTHMDITQRKQAEAALQASQAFLDETGRIAGVGGWAMDFESGEIQWTAETCRIHDCEPGHQPTVAEQIGYFAPEVQKTVQLAVQRTMEHGEGHDLELPMTTAKGRAIWVRAVGAAEIVDGRPVRLVGAMQDITARRTMESELRRNNEVMTAVLENLPCGLSVFDADLNLIAENGQFRRLIGLPDTMFEGRKPGFEEIIRYNADHGEYGSENVEATVRGIVERARAASVPHQFERVRPNGIPLEIRGAPMPAGGFVTTYVDITERKAAEVEVRRMRLDVDRLAQVARRTSNAVVMTDVARRITWVNEGFERITGYTSAESLGRSPGELLQFDGTDAETVGRMRAALHAGEGFKGNLLNRNKRGEVYRVELEIQPVYAEDGTLTGFMAVESDITRLVRATEAAEEASRAKSQFLANMSHEIRTPMNAIIGMTGLVLDTKIDAEQRELLDIVRNAGDALLALINDILDFSKIEAGQMTLEAADFDLHDCVRNAARMLVDRAREKGVTLECAIDRDVPRLVNGDSYRLRQVLLNVLSNAVKFTSVGWVLLSVTTSQAKTPDGGEVPVLEFRVRDTGAGIPADKLDQIFTPFGQADGSITRKYGGTGLGLSICTELVERMGGSISVDSVLGEGSTFRFSVRLALPAAGGEDAAGSSLPVASVHVTVLDRAPLPDKALLRCLEQWHYLPRVLRTPAQALQATLASEIGAEPLLVKASWLPLVRADQWERLCADRSRNARVLLQDAAVTPEQEAEFGHCLRWPGATASSLFDALAISGSRALGASDETAAAGESSTNSVKRYVLLVDDIAVNRKLATRLLENMGHVVAVATNGLEAVQHVMREQVDLVLMDLQMPVMDGFQATERIQQLEAGKARRTPIVAMTAHALQEERQRCLDAGMLGHVSKPISKQALRDAVQQHALPRAAADMPDKATQFSAAELAAPGRLASEPEATIAAAAAFAPLITEKGTSLRDEAAALDLLGGDRELLDELVEMFNESLAGQIDELRGAGASNDFSRLAKLAHAQKGAAGAVGASAARTAASALEVACMAGEADAAAGLLADLLCALEALREEATAATAG